MSHSRELMSSAADRVCAAIGLIDQPDMSAPTPCTDFDLAALVDHFLGTTRLLIQSGRRRSDASEGTDGPWQTRLTENLRELATVWSDPQTWHGEVPMGDRQMPAAMIGDMVYAEILLHGWDVTRAAGVELPVAEEMGSELRRGVQETAELGRQMKAYGPEVEVPDGASDFDHALGAAGRDPNWRP